MISGDDTRKEEQMEKAAHGYRLTSARIPPDIDAKLRDYMSRYGAVQNKVIIQALKEFLEKREGGE